MENAFDSLQKTVIAAPAGTQGVFAIGADNGDALYLDAVVALAILVHQDDFLRGDSLTTTPVGIAFDGSVALAIVAAHGTVYDVSGSSWPSLQGWLAEHAVGRPLIKDQFGDSSEPIPA